MFLVYKSDCLLFPTIIPQLKMTIPRALTFAVIAVFLQLTASEEFKLAVPNSPETGRIIGGRNAARGMFPFVVALHYNGNFICTASIISPTAVLTAAHCVVFEGVQQPANAFYGIANVRRNAPEVRINFASVTPHPDYDTSINNDLAVFRTTEPIPLDNDVQKICLASPSLTVDGKQAIIMGWGNTNRIRVLPPTIPENLQFANNRVVPNNACRIVYNQITEKQVCASGLLTGVCNGDSGGPLVIKEGDTFVEIGITSFINAIAGCGKPVPAVFTRVSSYMDFILQASGGEGVCMSPNA